LQQDRFLLQFYYYYYYLLHFLKSSSAALKVWYNMRANILKKIILSIRKATRSRVPTQNQPYKILLPEWNGTWSFLSLSMEDHTAFFFLIWHINLIQVLSKFFDVYSTTPD
jgi:hypothetical protein